MVSLICSMTNSCLLFLFHRRALARTTKSFQGRKARICAPVDSKRPGSRCFSATSRSALYTAIERGASDCVDVRGTCSCVSCSLSLFSSPISFPAASHFSLALSHSASVVQRDCPRSPKLLHVSRGLVSQRSMGRVHKE